MAYDKRYSMAQNFANGKGSRRRPTDESKFHEGWDRAFGNDTSEVISDDVELPPKRKQAILDAVEEEEEVKRAVRKCTPHRKRGEPFPWEKR